MINMRALIFNELKWDTYVVFLNWQMKIPNMILYKIVARFLKWTLLIYVLLLWLGTVVGTKNILYQ